MEPSEHMRENSCGSSAVGVKGASLNGNFGELVIFSSFSVGGGFLVLKDCFGEVSATE